MRELCLITGLFLIGATAEAQTEADTSRPAPDTVTADTTGPEIDTILFLPPEDRLPLENVADTLELESHLTQRPTTALFKSMAIPGWGQWGNKRYRKAIIFAGFEAWFIGASIHYGRQAGKFKDQYDAATTTDARNNLYGLYTDRRDERNKYLWFWGITTFISMFDAYVDAHLSGSPFLGGDNLNVGVDPASGEMRATVSVNF